MQKFTPFEKLSKKQKRELNAARRRNWGAVSPVTRVPKNPKAYDRKKSRYRSDEPGSGIFNLFYMVIL
ncbi:MAG: hypothetical protein LBN30_08235 [Oscillospiraceae bacterium]|jgi:hypothetical protein|nr:hypothetical protein [Oscillospiraceae bacterium]